MVVATKERLPATLDKVMGEDGAFYTIGPQLGDGGYGVVFVCKKGDKKYAVKAEKYSRSMLHQEIAVLKAAKVAHCKHFCQLVDYGTVNRDYVFMVMTLLSKDLHSLRAEQPERRFSPYTAIRLAIQTLEAIQELHGLGFLSRDVKPGNFAPGRREQADTIFLFDFGLCRHYRDKEGRHLESRGEVGWRGTTRYGSLRAHRRLDLGRKDDVESWLYLSVEIIKGVLPWRLVTDRTTVEVSKKMARNSSRRLFFEDCPAEYDSILTLVDALAFEDEPPYGDILKQLAKALERTESKTKNKKWDWAGMDTETEKTSRIMTELDEISQKQLEAENPSRDEEEEGE